MESVSETYLQTRAKNTLRIFKKKLAILTLKYETHKEEFDATAEFYNDRIKEANIVIEQEINKKTIKEQKKKIKQ